MQPKAINVTWAEEMLRRVQRRRARLARWAEVGRQFQMCGVPGARVFTVTRVTKTRIYFRARDDRPADRDRRIKKTDLDASIQRWRLQLLRRR